MEIGMAAMPVLFSWLSATAVAIKERCSWVNADKSDVCVSPDNAFMTAAAFSMSIGLELTNPWM